MSSPDPKTLATKPFRLTGWQIEPRLHRISQGATTHQLEPKIMQVLVCLAQHAGQPVTREHLLATVWAETVVTDDVLTRSVSTLRKVFGDNPRQPKVIETIPKVGYRLLVAAESATPASGLQDRPEHTATQTVRQWRWEGAGMLATLVVMLGGGWLWVQQTRPIPQTPLQTRPLTTFPGLEYGGALSPSGTQVAFSRRTPEEGTVDIYVSPITSMAPLRLTDSKGSELNPVWSPDEQHIAFIERTADTCTVFKVSALGGPAEVIATCHPSAYPNLSWSPDGKTLALSDRTESSMQAIYFVDIETGDRKQVTEGLAGGRGDTGPQFSPDGKHLAFQRGAGDGVEDLYVLTLADGTLKRLTCDDRSIAGADWTPDGQALIFSSDRAGEYSFWQVAVTGGEPTWVAINEFGYRPSVSRQTGQFVFEHWEIDTNIYRLDLRNPGQAPQVFMPSTRMDGAPAYAPDGQRVAFTSNRSGRYDVWLGDAAGNQPFQQTTTGYHYAAGLQWSPDGQRLAFFAYQEGNADVYVIDRMGEAPRRLTTADAQDRSPFWSPDGKWIYFGSNRGEQWQIWRVSVGGGDPTPVTTVPATAGKLTADGHYLYFAREGYDGLWRMTLPDGEPEAILPQLASYDATAWDLNDAGIYFFDRTNPRQPSVSFLAHDGQSPEALYQLPSSPEDIGMSLSPDGNALLYVQIDQGESDLMLVEGI